MPVELDFTNPLLRSLLLPFLAAIVASGVIRMFAGPWRGVVHGAVGIGIGFLAFVLIRYGFVGWPIKDGIHMLGLVIVAAMLGGIVLDELELPEFATTITHLAVPLLLVFWLGSEIVGEKLTTRMALMYGALTIAGFWLLERLEQDRDEGMAPHLGVAMALASLAIIALIRGNSMFEPAAALATATLGFAVINWPRQRLPWGAGAGLVTGAGYLAIATLMLFADGDMKIPVGLSLLAFISSPAAQKYFRTKPVLEPFVQILFGLIAVLLSAVAATMV